MMIKRLFSKQFIEEGGVIPDWYGVAYLEYDRRVVVAYLIPLNWLVRWAREIYFRIKWPHSKSYRDRIEKEIADKYERRMNERIASYENCLRGALRIFLDGS